MRAGRNEELYGQKICRNELNINVSYKILNQNKVFMLQIITELPYEFEMMCHWST